MKIYQLQQEKWGVCGFIAAIQAAHANGKEVLGSDKKSISSKFDRNDAADKEVLTTSHELLSHFIKIFKQYCPAQTAIGIVTFTRSFGDEFKKPKNDVYALDAYCEMMINDTTFTSTDLNFNEKPALGFAMTPEGMDKLLKEIFHFDTTSLKSLSSSEWNQITENNRELNFRNSIVGLSSDVADKQNYNGLKHWIYIDKEGKPYSWGKKYESLKDFLNIAQLTQVCYASSSLDK